MRKSYSMGNLASYAANQMLIIAPVIMGTYPMEVQVEGPAKREREKMLDLREKVVDKHAVEKEIAVYIKESKKSHNPTLVFMSISDNLFSVEIYLGGNFDLGPPKQYVNGSCARLEKVRPDEFYMSSIKEIMMECEYFEDYRVFCKLHESSVDDGYILINTDESLHDAFTEHQNLKKVVLYIEHLQEEHVVPEASEEHEIGFETIHTKDAFLDDRATNTNFGDPNSGNISDSDVVEALSSTPETAREHDHGEWTPTVDDINRPKLGMQFASLEEGKLFYYAYGKLGGFSIRKGSTNLDRKTRELITKYYVCSKQGESTAKVLQGETIKELPVGSTAGCVL